MVEGWRSSCGPVGGRPCAVVDRDDDEECFVGYEVDRLCRAGFG